MHLLTHSLRRPGLCLALLCTTISQADWPAFRHDAARTAYTEEHLPEGLSPAWHYHAMHAPKPAWPRQDRMAFDRAFQPIVAEGQLFFGSSADDAIRALDLETGNERWTFFTEGPIRFAPSYAEGMLYATSDDGYLYALNAADGSLRWKKRGGADDRKILGNGRMISIAPARGGPVVHEGTVYFAAGIWPSDGIFLHALDALTGETLWLNDTAGSIYMPQPHGGANATSGVSSQGYLAASASHIFMPTGRAVPAAFHRNTGTFDYFHLQRNGHSGGASMMVHDAFFLNGGKLFRQADGSAVGHYSEGPMAGHADGFICSASKSINTYRWAEMEKTDRKGTTIKQRGFKAVTNFTGFAQATSIASTPDHLILGLENELIVIDRSTGSAVWSNTVVGTVYGLAVTSEGLFASTDRGELYGFTGEQNTLVTHQPTPLETPYPPNPQLEAAATEILARTRKSHGFCLDLSCGEGQLAWELARRSSLQIIGLSDNPEQIAHARKRLSAAGMYGSRITLLEAPTHLPDYFADLIVSAASVLSGATELPEQLSEVQRPYGGTHCLGKPGAMRMHVRGELPGAGQWTHQYANPANTVNSNDTIIQGRLRMLWFDDPGQQMVQRHGRAPAPLFYNGTIFSEGLNGLYAVDAYNGRTKWTYALPGVLQAYDGDHLMGTSGTGSNYCAADDCVYLRRDQVCYRIDAETGKLLNTFPAPAGDDGRPGTWGYIASEHGRIYGSLSDTNHVVTYRYQDSGDMAQQLTQSKTLFALYAEDGDLKWRYDAQDSIRHNAIAASSNQLLFVDAPLAAFDQVRKGKATPSSGGRLVALDAESGEVNWSREDGIYGTVLAISEPHQAVLMSYQPSRFGLASETGGRLSVFDLRTGAPLWEKKADYASRPMINDRTVYAQGGAWDLLTGEPQPFNFKRSYGCGVLAGAKNMMVFRSGTLGYFDLTRNEQTEDYGGIRPGCWINVIPAGGLVIAPDAASGCRCSYQNQSWIALQPGGLRAPQIFPPGGTSREAIEVILRADHPEKETVRFTTDGSTPRTSSTAYTRPIRLEKTSRLLARSFDNIGVPGPMSEAEFHIDPELLPLQANQWRAWDAPGLKETSDWRITANGIEQHSNIFTKNEQTLSKDPGVERQGSLYQFVNGPEFADGTISFVVNSKDNDGIGIAFRMQDEQHYYLWSMNAERNFRVLAKKDAETFTVLAENDRGFQPQTDYAVEVRLNGPQLSIYVNGEQDVEVEDATFSHGTIGLHTWGNDNVRFSRLKFIAE
ncbi:MAG: outer membrane protein assembly factor BamB [Candidatus Omnitrophota bacterium]|jgi:outer membrane protein assembly factor BamB